MYKLDLTLITGIEDEVVKSDTPIFQVEQNYPNPFNNETTIGFNLMNNTHVKIEILGIQGRIVKTLINKDMPAGKHKVSWNGCNKSGFRLPAGSYLYKIESGNYSQTRKMLLME